MEDTQKEKVKNDTLRTIHSMVSVVKQNKKVSVEYMKIYEKEQMLREIGFEEGQSKKVIELVRKKLAKGYSAEEIADMLEESIEVIRKVIEELKSEK